MSMQFSNAQEADSTFNPREHLIQIKSNGANKPAQDYLEAKWRLVWFRSKCPHGTIHTEITLLDMDAMFQEDIWVWNAEKRTSEKHTKEANGWCVFKAIVTDGEGGVSVAHKSCKAVSFADFIGKAETGAIARALACLGYGTQFTEADELDEGVPSDTGVTRSTSNGNKGGSLKGLSAEPEPTTFPTDAAAINSLLGAAKTLYLEVYDDGGSGWNRLVASVNNNKAVNMEVLKKDGKLVQKVYNLLMKLKLAPAQVPAPANA